MTAGRGATRPARTIAAAAVGNAFEWYDFSVYVLFAPLIANAFFPADSETGRLVKAFLIFGVGFIARPVGAILIGYYGDRAGRKAALSLTFALMAAGTLIIAISPTHAQIGVAAPILILAGRLLQGLSAGGEIGGAAAFLVEHAPADRRAYYAAWLQASMAISNILGALVALSVRVFLPETALDVWGWRIPFLFGLLIVPIGLWLRASLPETPAFEAARAARPRSSRLLAALPGQAGNLVKGFGISILWGVSVYALVIFMPVYYQEQLGFDPGPVSLAALLGNLVLIGTCLVSGRLADRIGRRRLMTIAAAALLVLVPVLMIAVEAVRVPTVLVLVQASFCGLVGLYAGAAPAVLAELYPPAVRSTAMSVAYNGAIMLFAGFAPAIITWLSSGEAGELAPAVYVSVSAAVALVAIRTMGAPARSAA